MFAATLNNSHSTCIGTQQAPRLVLLLQDALAKLNGTVKKEASYGVEMKTWLPSPGGQYIHRKVLRENEEQ